MRCGLIAEQSGGVLSLERRLDVLKVHRSSYYRWSRSAFEPKLDADTEMKMTVLMKRLFLESLKPYGVPRMWHALLQEGYACSRRQVREMMRKNQLVSVYNRKKQFMVTTDSRSTRVPAKNLLKRDFTADTVNQKWVGDVTYIKTGEGWLFLAVVIDLFSRKVVWLCNGRE